MIEPLLEAERALSAGLVDRAERIYRQAAEADPRSSIAVVGLARVALERGDDREAHRLARRALEIDPDNDAARRLADRLVEIMRARGDAVPADVAPTPPAPPPGLGAAGRAATPRAATPRAAAPWPATPRPATPRPPKPAPAKARQKRPSLLRRLLGR